MITETSRARRIPAEEYEVIVDAFSRGVPVKELAGEYGVSPTRIYQILKAQGIRASDYDVRADPTGLEAVIERHQSPYDDARTRQWIAQALTAWEEKRSR